MHEQEGKPATTGLQAFETMVLEDLWKAICFEFPPPPPPLSELEFERSFHEHFVEDRSRQFVGRQGLISRMVDMINSKMWVQSLPLVCIGAPGSGKTSLVTSFAKVYAESNTSNFTLVHVVSASPTSTDIREVLLRICRELEEEFDLASGLDETDYQTIREAFARTLEVAGGAAKARRRGVLLVIDAVNQLSNFYNAHTMDWFPTYMPPGVQALISTIPESPCLAALAKRDPPPPQLVVPPLSMGEREEIVVQQLSEYRKKLTPQQLSLLMAKPESHKPLFLLTVCEELRLQAQYGQTGLGVDEKIQQLPGTVSHLLDVVLERVERDLSTWASSGAVKGFNMARMLLGRSKAGGDEDRASTVVSIATGATGEEKGQEGGSVAGGQAADREFFDGADDSAESVGRALVRQALTLLVCSRHGLRENELLEMLAPPGLTQLPPAVWARLYRSLELYLQPMGEGEHGQWTGRCMLAMLGGCVPLWCLDVACCWLLQACLASSMNRWCSPCAVGT